MCGAGVCLFNVLNGSQGVCACVCVCVQEELLEAIEDSSHRAKTSADEADTGPAGDFGAPPRGPARCGALDMRWREVEEGGERRGERRAERREERRAERRKERMLQVFRWHC